MNDTVATKDVPIIVAHSFNQVLLDKFKNKPTDIIQFICAGLMVIGFVSVLAGWIIFDFRQHLQIPLLLFGISAIVLIFTISQRGLAIIFALLIIGTVIISEDVVVRIANIFEQNIPLKSFFANNQLQGESANQLSQETRTQLVKAFGNKLSLQDADTLNSALKRKELLHIKARVGKSRTFHELADGVENWDRYANTWHSNELFIEEINQLQYEGVIKCSSGNLIDCKLTDVGKDVIKLHKLVETLMTPEMVEKLSVVEKTAKSSEATTKNIEESGKDDPQTAEMEKNTENIGESIMPPASAIAVEKMESSSTPQVIKTIEDESTPEIQPPEKNTESIPNDGTSSNSVIKNDNVTEKAIDSLKDTEQNQESSENTN